MAKKTPQSPTNERKFHNGEKVEELVSPIKPDPPPAVASGGCCPPKSADSGGCCPSDAACAPSDACCAPSKKM